MIPVKPKDVTWTDEQWSAIYEDNKSIIVSAGAGSGKTAVLTERVIRKLKDGVNVNELLILTFTKAAAAEMADRIRKKIKKDKALLPQLNLLDSAYITTFDSFSLSIVKKYHYLLNVSSNIGIIDPSVIDLEKKAIMNTIFSEYYEKEEPEFLDLISNFCLKDDQELQNYILNISNKLDLLSNKEEYLETYLATFFNDTKLETDINAYLQLIWNKIDQIKQVLEEISYLDNDYRNKLEDSLNYLLETSDYDELVTIISKLKLPPVPRGSSDELKELKTSISDLLKDIKALCSYTSKSDIKDFILLTKNNLQVIITIILDFTKRIKAYKYTKDAYEFNDIAIMAINIVKNNPDIQTELRNSFQEIMIDEYQDTSDLQEEFISLIEKNNVYMVGDIKQSIYRFRNANPYIFKNKYDTYSQDDNPSQKIDLNKNFRSRKEVLDNINIIFNLIMDDQIGGADYIKSHQMIFGNTSYLKDDPHHSNDMELYSYPYDPSIGFSKEEIEAFIVANDIIKKKNSHHQVFDKDNGNLRDLTYNDICIIMDRATNFDLYKKIFSYLHIPLTLYKDDTMSNDKDVYVINNLIRLLLKIHTSTFGSEFKYLFISLSRSFLNKQDDDTIFNYFLNNNFKDNSFYKDLLELSYDIDSLGIVEIIDKLLDKFNYYNQIISISNIKASIVKIDKIKEMATNLESLGYNIYTFSSYLQELLDNGYDLRYTPTASETSSVKIMTIHKSKGLEYPLCYYTGLYKKFNIADLNELFIYDKKYGLVIPFYKEGLGDTIYKELVKNNYIKEEISEKIRLFYVALTRAREKMILVLPQDDNKYPGDNLTLSLKETYRSFKDILNSITKNIPDKYTDINLEDQNLTKEYNLLTKANYKTHLNLTSDKFTVTELSLTPNYLDTTSFSKKTTTLITKKDHQKLELGTKIHEFLEFLDFKNPNYSLISDPYYTKKIKSFLENPLLKDLNQAKIYKEYEFIDSTTEEIQHGIIDLMLEYDTKIDIIDYKLKDTTDPNYLNQLQGYKNYIKKNTKKEVNIYLYSIIDEKFTKL